jgi:hypothetical protein
MLYAVDCGAVLCLICKIKPKSRRERIATSLCPVSTILLAMLTRTHSGTISKGIRSVHKWMLRKAM